MTDREQIEKLYLRMYEAMVSKDAAELEAVHDDSFVLHHMTGMSQSKREYIDAILNGTLNYYSASHDELCVTVSGDTARLSGKSRVSAAVFGGGRHIWRLKLEFDLVKKNGRWVFTSASASTY